MSNLLPGLRVVVESIHNNLEADCIKRLNKNATSLLKNNLTFKNKGTLQWKSSSKIPWGKQVSPRKRKTTKKKQQKTEKTNKTNKPTEQVILCLMLSWEILLCIILLRRHQQVRPKSLDLIVMIIILPHMITWDRRRHRYVGR